MNKTIILFLLFFCHCSNPSKNLEKGNFQQAYKSSLNALKKGKDYEENQKILIQALDHILEKEILKKDRLQNSDDLKHKEKSIKTNQSIQQKITKALPFLDGHFDGVLEKLKIEQQQTTLFLADHYFSLGTNQLEKAQKEKDKVLAQKAYYNFLKTKEFESTKTELEDLIQKSLKLGQIVYNIEKSAPFDVTSHWEIDRTFEDLEKYQDRFTKVFYDGSLKPEDIDCQITIRFSALDIDLDKDKEEEDFEKEIVTGTTTVTNSNGEEEEVDVVEEIEGSISIQELKKTATWEVRVEVTSHSKNCTISDTSFEEEVVSTAKIISLAGDQRAIPNEYKKTNKDELNTDEEMMEVLLEALYEKVASHLF